MLGQALELEYGVDLTIGPSLEEGFYYDCYMGDKTLTDQDKTRIEKRVESSIKENQKFERIVVTREEALSMFEENKFKVCMASLHGLLCSMQTNTSRDAHACYMQPASLKSPLMPKG